MADADVVKSSESKPVASEAGVPQSEQQSSANVSSAGLLWSLFQGGTTIASSVLSNITNIVAAPSHIVSPPTSTVAQGAEVGMGAAKTIVTVPATVAAKVSDGGKDVFDRSVNMAGYMADSTKAAFDGTITLVGKIGAIPHYTMDESLAIASRAGEAAKQAFDNTLAAVAKAGDISKTAVDSSLNIASDAAQTALMLSEPDKVNGHSVIPSIDRVPDVVTGSAELVSRTAGMTYEAVRGVVAGSGELALKSVDVGTTCGKQVLDESFNLAAKAGQSTKEIFDATVTIAQAVGGASVYNNGMSITSQMITVPAHVVSETVSALQSDLLGGRASTEKAAEEPAPAPAPAKDAPELIAVPPKDN